MKHVYVAQAVLCMLWLSMRLADLCKLIRVEIPLAQIQILQAGGVMVFANHPSFIETYALRYALDKLSGRSVWTVTLKQRFRPAWHEILRCIPVCRTAGRNQQARLMNKRALHTCSTILASRGVVVVYPEGTRTCNAIQTMSDSSGQRRVGICKDTFLVSAANQGVPLIPVWIEHGDCSTPQGFGRGYVKLFLYRVPIVLTFGSPLIGKVSPPTIAKSLLATAHQ